MRQCLAFAVLAATLCGLAQPAQADPAAALSFASLMSTGTVNVQLRVSPRLDVPHAVNFLDTALRYLAQSPTARATVACVQRSARPVLLLINDQQVDQFYPDRNAIVWDPRAALIATNGARITPALALAHEMRHACSFARDPRGMSVRQLQLMAGYDNGEERDAIENGEAPIARELSEDIRDDHHGRVYFVSSPLYR